MGYPTANLSIQDSTKLIPANGVYAVKCYIDDKVFCGMMNIGIRPTVSSQEMLTLEVHLFDFSDTIYGQFVHVHFISRIRNEQRFNSVNELKEQLNKDERMARAMLLDLVR
jgi:riboflavin kinase/FMN adenylyltransferase